MIRFFEDAHKYIGKDEEVYTSVTKVIHSYEQDKDWDKIARTYSKKHGIELEEVKRRWDYERDKSVVRGNKYHKEREVELLNSPFLEVDGCELGICPCECKDGIKYSRSLKLEPGVYPELIIWLDSAKIAGQADYVEVVNGKINIKDYKTNKEIKTKGFKKWDGTTEKLKFPLQNFDACNYNIYSLQLNMYMYMLLRHNPGLRKGTMELLHIQFNEDDTPVDTTIYKIKDLQTDVKRMIGHWMKTHK